MTYDSDCSVCKREVKRGTSSRWLSCQKCGDWFHAVCLGSVYQKNYAVLKLKNVWWFCNKCEREVSGDWGLGEKAEDPEEEEEGQKEEKEVRVLDHDYGVQEEGKQRNHNEEELENEIHSDETHSTEEKRKEDTSKEK